MARYWYQTCPACATGRLFVERRHDTAQLFLECEQCCTSWNTPEDLERPGFSGIQIISDYASSEDVRKAGWSKYPLQVALDREWPAA
jgi:hypothetical protein